MRLRFAELLAYGLGITTILVATQGLAVAAGPVPLAAPELDGASISAAVGVLAAGILILRSRRRTK
jgi:hypothetical protein